MKHNSMGLSLAVAGLSLGAMTRAALATTSIASHEARLQTATYDDPRMHMTIDELRALPGGVVEPIVEPVRDAQDAKRARRAARMGTVPVVINRRAPDPVPAKPKRKSRAKNAA